MKPSPQLQMLPHMSHCHLYAVPCRGKQRTFNHHKYVTKLAITARIL